jgi:uncharacterized protein YkwD
MHTTLRRVLRVVAVGLIACTLTAGCAQARARLDNASVAPPRVNAPAAAAERMLAARINDLRAARGMPPLRSHPVLVAKARRWSAAMAGGRCGRDDDGIGKICHSVMADGVTVRWRKLAENVGLARPRTNVVGMAHGFENSPTHLENLLLRDVQYVGVGVAYARNTLYVTQVFMSLQ